MKPPTFNVVEEDGSLFAMINDGPSKWDLMMLIFGNNWQRPTIHFRTQDGRIFHVNILGIERADGSGDSFNFRGLYHDPESREVRDAEGYFTTGNRSGWLRIKPAGADPAATTDIEVRYGPWMLFEALRHGAIFESQEFGLAVKQAERPSGLYALTRLSDGVPVTTTSGNLRVREIILMRE